LSFHTLSLPPGELLILFIGTNPQQPAYLLDSASVLDSRHERWLPADLPATIEDRATAAIESGVVSVVKAKRERDEGFRNREGDWH
jgi:hypothetical protein